MSTWHDGIIQPVVWLTSDPSGIGHGLPDGQETLSDRNMDHCARVDGERPRNTRTHDKMKVRLTFDIPDDDLMQLQRFTDYCATVPDGKAFARWTGVSCYIDVVKADPRRVKAMMKSYPTKEKTWWISFMPVSASFITAVELRSADGQYLPYDFERLMRPAMAELGIFSPSAAALQELQQLVQPVHHLSDAKALVICARPDLRPAVALRGNCPDRIFCIENGDSMLSQADNDPKVSAWISKYRAELMETWHQAVESYFSFYPDHRALYST